MEKKLTTNSSVYAPELYPFHRTVNPISIWRYWSVFTPPFKGDGTYLFQTLLKVTTQNAKKFNYPYHPCMVYSSICTINIMQNVHKYTIHGSYGLCIESEQLWIPSVGYHHIPPTKTICFRVTGAIKVAMAALGVTVFRIFHTKRPWQTRFYTPRSWTVRPLLKWCLEDDPFLLGFGKLFRGELLNIR